MKIVVDAMGGDYSPSEIVKGCVSSLKNHKDLTIVLVGQEVLINKELENTIFPKERLIIENANDIITCHEAPVEAVRTKNDSSIVKGLDYLKNNEDAQAFVSAGSTGAVLTGAFLKLGRMQGIKRPALAPLFPTAKGGKVMFIDCGANMDTNETNLVQFALMGHAYMKSVQKIESPRIALLSVGAEDEKGNELVKKAFPLLKEQKINFVGNVEARDVLSGDYDVIVCDGFAGNVLTKSIEGAVSFTMKVVKENILKTTWRKISALFLKKAFKDVKETFKLDSIGGAPFLGVNKLVLKAHGNSKSKNIESAINEVVEFIKGDLIESIRKTLTCE